MNIDAIHGFARPLCCRERDVKRSSPYSDLRDCLWSKGANSRTALPPTKRDSETYDIETGHIETRRAEGCPSEKTPWLLAAGTDDRRRHRTDHGGRDVHGPDAAVQREPRGSGL